MEGGRLVLDMGPEPNLQWAVHAEPPHTYRDEPLITPPYVSSPENSMSRESVKMFCRINGLLSEYLRAASATVRDVRIPELKIHRAA